MRKRRQRGFALIELVVAVAIIGIVAAIAMPNLLDALDRGRQSSTAADMRTIATALERYAFDHHRYPDADGAAALRPELEPRYVKKLPLADGWDHPFVYEVEEAGTTYTLASPGKDGELQPGGEGFAADLVMVDGVFVAGPAGEVG